MIFQLFHPFQPSFNGLRTQWGRFVRQMSKTPCSEAVKLSTRTPFEIWRYVPDSSVGNLWYKNNFSRMPGSWRFHGGTNIPPYVEGVCDVLGGVVECKRRRGAKNESSSKTSLISHTVHYTGTFHMCLKGIEFPHFYISLHVPVCFDGEAIHSPLHMQKCAVI